MTEKQTHGKALREVKDTSIMRGPMEKSFCFFGRFPGFSPSSFWKK